MLTKRSNIIYFGIGAIFLAMLPLYFLYDPNGGAFPKCPFLNLTGLYCTGCGSQRAIHDLLHLDIIGAVKHNALLLPALILVGYHGISKYLGYRRRKNYPSLLYHPRTPIVILAVIIIFTVLRNIDIFPFNLLAP